MNILGHVYIASKVTGRVTPFLAAGCWLPDIVPFVPQKIFTFEQIHESGDQFFKFLNQKYPQRQDLALGMVAHSVKYGADKFNREIEDWLLKGRNELKKEIARNISSCSGVSLKVASGYRMHNYLWGGIDVYILREHFSFVEQLEKMKSEIDTEEISQLLADFFGRDNEKVKKVVDQLMEPVKKYQLTSLDGLIKIWKEALAVLPEKDQVKEGESRQLFVKIFSLFENDWPEIIEKVERSVAKNLYSFLEPQS